MIGRDKTKEDACMLSVLLRMFNRHQLNKNHPLQRKADQWDIPTKSGLVATVIKGEDVDSIKICEQIVGSSFILWLIDGLQRLTTLEEYKNGVFSISKNLTMPMVYYQKIKGDKIEVIEYDLRNQRWDDLPEELKDNFNSYSIKVVKHLDCTDEEISYHIDRYNRQKNMSTHQKSVLPMYKIANKIKSISQKHKFFKDAGHYTTKEDTNGVIDRIVFETIMLMFYPDKWSRGKTMTAFLNDNATDEEFAIFNSELDALSEIIDYDTTGQLFNSKNSFILFTFYHRFKQYKLDDKLFVAFLKEFQNNLHNKEFREYENLSFDTYDKNRSTKDKKVIMVKLNMLDQLLKDFLHINNTSALQETTEIIEEGKNNVNIDDIEIVNFVKENVDKNTIVEDIQEYNSFLESCIKTSSDLYKKAKFALIALVASAYKEDTDEELGIWLEEFQKEKIDFSINQKENYLYLKKEFQDFIM